MQTHTKPLAIAFVLAGAVALSAAVPAASQPSSAVVADDRPCC